MRMALPLYLGNAIGKKPSSAAADGENGFRSLLLFLEAMGAGG